MSYPASALNTPDEDAGWSGIAPGSLAIDGPLGKGRLLNRLDNDFVLLVNGAPAEPMRGLAILDIGGADILLERYDLKAGSACLVRPDQYIAARWRVPTAVKVSAAVARAKGGAHAPAQH